MTILYSDSENLIQQAREAVLTYISENWMHNPTECYQKVKAFYDLLVLHWGSIKSEQTPIRYKRELNAWIKHASKLQQLDGQELTTQEMLKHFGYSPKTYYRDALLFSHPWLSKKGGKWHIRVKNFAERE